MASFSIKHLLAVGILVIILNEVSSQNCQRIEVPMCKGLVNYNFTRLPNKFGHADQSAVYWALQQWWPFMDMGCSKNFRLLICGLYLPKCTAGGSNNVQLPCRETCRRAKNRCAAEMRRQNLPWSSEFRCPQFLPRSSGKCLTPLKERKKKKPRRHVSCQRNRLSMCSDLPYRFGSLPNMFLQSNVGEMRVEMAQYQPLIDSNCSPHLEFFLCGVYMPFCLKRGNRQCDVPFVVPCREVCETVQERCGHIFTRQRGGLPWPGKLHCHRYPSQNTTSSDECTVSCVMPT